jgi:predicted anti-sigma-YlaC factor YlaD
VNSSKAQGRAAKPSGVPHPMGCDRIRPLLFDYMSRELGESRAALVREHIRHCEACQHELAAIEATVSDLRSGAASTKAAGLTERRRKRLTRLASNPFLNWIDENHRLVAMLLALLSLLIILLSLRNVTVNTFEPEDVGETIPIWRYFRSGPLPERVKEAAARHRAAQTNAAQTNATIPVVAPEGP